MTPAQLVRAIRKPTWLLGLSNAELLAKLDASLEVYNDQGETRDLKHRLDLLCDEISRRERAGTLTEEDWKE